MKILLDTHIFLWFISGDFRLDITWKTAIKNTNNEIYLSVVSIWEAMIKYKLGKLPLPELPEIYLPQQRKKHKINSLIVDESSVIQLANLPLIHNDPFDRLLICQAKQFNLIMMTVDNKIKQYSMIEYFENIIETEENKDN
jgi:PIN domain nuclease of toxin-antitoxin system